MKIQPDIDLTLNPLSLITTRKNLHLLKIFLSEGLNPGKVRDILMDYSSVKVVLQDMMRKATNPEWTEHKAYMKKTHSLYGSAIKNLEKILSIEKPFSPSDIMPNNSTEKQIKENVLKDIATLKKRQDSLLDFKDHPALTPTIKPRPATTHQMIGFQSYALYRYLRKLRSKDSITDKQIYNFIAELLSTYYKDTSVLQGPLSGDVVKRNFVDNIEKTTSKKYRDFEKSCK